MTSPSRLMLTEPPSAFLMDDQVDYDNDGEEYELDDYDGHRRRVNSYFSKEQEDEFERIFERELEAGQKYTRRELRETARSLKIAPGGELKLFRWFENRRAWMKQRTKRQTPGMHSSTSPNHDSMSSSSSSSSSSHSQLAVKRRRITHMPMPSVVTMLDLTMALNSGSSVTVNTHTIPYECTSMIQPTDAHNSTTSAKIRVSTVAFHSTNVGTVLTTPLLIDPSGRGIADLSLQSVVCQGLIIDCSEYLSKKREHNAAFPNAIDCDAFPTELAIANQALVIHTGFHQVTSAQPFLTETAAKVLSEKNLAMVAIDCPSVDPPIKQGSTLAPILGPSKMLLLKNRVTVLENLAHVDELLHTLNTTRQGSLSTLRPSPFQTSPPSGSRLRRAHVSCYPSFINHQRRCCAEVAHLIIIVVVLLSFSTPLLFQSHYAASPSKPQK